MALLRLDGNVDRFRRLLLLHPVQLNSIIALDHASIRIANSVVFLTMVVLVMAWPGAVKAITFEEWRNGYFAPESGWDRYDMTVTGIHADPDGDGVPILLEFALGLDPLIASTAGLPVMAIENGFLT